MNTIELNRSFQNYDA